MSDDRKSPDSGLKPILELLPTRLKNPNPIRDRLLSDPFLVDPSNDGPILYQHSVLCQTCLPYRDPGATVRTWERVNGVVSLLLAAGQAFNPDNRCSPHKMLPTAGACIEQSKAGRRAAL